MGDPVQLLIDAFNRADRAAMVELLHPDAATELVGSPHPPEQGPSEIREGSFEHLLADESALVARRVGEEDSLLIALTHRAGGALDSAIALRLADDAIIGLRYHTQWHDLPYVEGLAQRLGVPLARES